MTARDEVLNARIERQTQRAERAEAELAGIHAPTETTHAEAYKTLLGILDTAAIKLDTIVEREGQGWDGEHHRHDLVKLRRSIRGTVDHLDRWAGSWDDEAPAATGETL